MAGHGIEIGTAYLSLTADGSGLGRSISDAVGQAQSHAESSSRGIGSKIALGIGKTLKGGAVAVGVAAGGLLGTALTKGFQRLNAIDTAKKKLAGLGNSAKDVNKIMGNALASVKGTAFGLDEAATTAASVVAAGVKPGKQLQGVLKTVADTATIAGSSMSDMGAIFGSVAARGKLQGDDLMQLQSRGVPVLAFLAKHYKTTAAAASQMVSDGKVDFKNFAAAMHENLGGAAKKSGDTVNGAFANLKASLGRIGANLLAGVFPKIAPTLMSITKAMGPLEDKASKVGEAIGSLVSKGFSKLMTVAKGAVQVFKMLFSNHYEEGPIKPTSKLIDVVFSLRDAVVGLWNKIKPALAQLGAALVKAFKSIDWTSLAGTVAGVFSTIADFAKQAVPIIVRLAKAFIANLLPVVKAVADFIVHSLWPGIQQLVQSLAKNLLPILQELARQFITNVLPPLKKLALALVSVAKAVMPVIVWLGKLIFSILGKVIPIILRIAGPVIGFLLTALADIVSGVAVVITWLVKHLWPGLKWAFEQVASKAKWLWNNGIKPAFDGIKTAAQAVKDKFWDVMHGIRDAYNFLKDKTLGAVKWVVDKFLWFAQKILDGAAKAFGWIPGVGGKLKNAASGFKSFREKVNRELSKIQDKKVKVDLKTPGLSSAVGLLGGPKVTQFHAAGGTVAGQRAPYGDKVLVGLAPGEEVISNRNGQADRHRGLLKAINNGTFHGLADGGTVFDVQASGLNTGAAAFAQFSSSMNRFTSSIVSKLSKAWGALFGTAGGGNYSVSGGVQRWAGVARTAMRMAGLPLSFLPLLLHRMQVESGGNPRAINLWDSNARAGDPSRGLMQTIGSTFRAYAGALVGRGIYDPLANIYAAIRYTLARYGLRGIARAWGGVGGYANGTLSARPGLALVGERGPELMAMRGGERVYTNRETQRMLGTDGPQITNNIYAPSDDAKEIARELSWGLRYELLPSVYGRR